MSSTSGSSLSQWPTWQAHAAALAPSARRAAATSSQASGLRLTTTTLAPDRANALAMASPRPRVPPVTRATRSVRSKRSLTSSAGLVMTVSSGWDNGATSWELGVGMVVAEGEIGDAVAGAVVDDALGDGAGVEQEVEVTE